MIKCINKGADQRSHHGFGKKKKTHTPQNRSLFPSNWLNSCSQSSGGRFLRLLLLPAAAVLLQPRTFFFKGYVLWNGRSCCRWGMVSGRCRRDRADSYLATSPFCPAALCPLCLPRTGANVCLLAVSSSCKLEESPETDTKTKRKTGRQVSNRSHEERRDICCSGFYGRSIQKKCQYCFITPYSLQP